MNNCSNKSVAKLYERHGGGCQLVNPLYLRQNCIIWPGYGIASADSNQNLLSTLRREPKTAKCAETAGLITWQAAIVFLECFLLPPQLDANYIIMMINVSTTLSSDWKSDQSKVFWSLSLGISIPVCIKCPRKLFPWRESSAGWVQITRLSFSWLTQ